MYRAQRQTHGQVGLPQEAALRHNANHLKEQRPSETQARHPPSTQKGFPKSGTARPGSLQPLNYAPLTAIWNPRQSKADIVEAAPFTRHPNPKADNMFDSFILPGIPAPLFWGLVAAAIIIQGISKSGFAGGAGILSLPLMMLVMPVDKVAATLLPLLILCDLNAIYHHRHNKDWTQIRRIYIPACIGILLGAAVWWKIGQDGVAF